MMRRRDFLCTTLAAAAMTPAAQAANIRSVAFGNDLWAIDLDPATLKISVTPKGQQALTVSDGLPARPVADFVSALNGMTWTWQANETRGKVQVECALNGHDLELTFIAEQPETLELLRQPATAMGRGLILPLAEGRYVPSDSPEWRADLTNAHNDINTTEDLTLPLWGMDRGAFTLHWLMINPFNNRLNFTEASGGLDLKLTHEFTRLSPTTPMTMTLHLGDTLLSGAQRYKQHLIDSSQYQTLADKIRVTPGTEKLIGAPQIYLWGNGLIGVPDVKDWPEFLKTLRGNDPFAVRLREALDAEALDQLKALPVSPAPYEQRIVVRHVNQAVLSLARGEWQQEEIDHTRLTGIYPELRQQFQAAFKASLAPDPATWGEGLSKRTITALKGGGFDRLWIGLGDGFEGGLWHPEVVSAAADAGYLIAPYDDYMGLIAPGERPDWATSQQGRKLFETCPIVLANGQPRKGFMGTGFYANTICVTGSLKARVTALKKTAGYNSWFSDVSATGMVFDDYRPGHEMTQSQHANANNVAHRWWSETVKVPLGSEVGNAVTSQGIAFAQGTETPVIGWGDPDLATDQSSPYYTGNWFPPEQPGKFFAPAKTKPKYRALHFAPGVVVPLYQAVFHGSIITSHHWTYDNLKLSDVAQDRELTQLLHNVAPTYHLSAGSLSERIPVIQRQYAVFRRLHEALALQALTGFAYLSDDKLIQRTTFADGSEITVNYDDKAREVAGVMLTFKGLRAVLPTGEVITYLSKPAS
jgi:hypothetical protein